MNETVHDYRKKPIMSKIQININECHGRRMKIACEIKKQQNIILLY